jgi:hypothetical protein
MNTTLLQLKLHRHIFMEQSELPEMPGSLVYVIAGNGVFLWGKRDGLEALIPVSECTIRGLYPVAPFVRLDGPRLPSDLVDYMVQIVRRARSESGLVGFECLFYLAYAAGDPQAWEVTMPSQIQTPVSVRPVLEELDSLAYAQVLMEVHSHPAMSAFYSGTDDRDEKGFRLYGVIGLPWSPDGDQAGQVEICMRISIFGSYWDIPPEWVLDLPDGLVAAGPQDDGNHHEEGDTHAKETAS